MTVERLGRDSVLRFQANDWVELLDDTHELDGRPGIIAQVGSVDDSQNTVTLKAALPGPIDVQRNARMRRWDQSTGLTGGVIKVTAFGQTIALEDGVKVKLDLADPNGRVRTGDWWVFAARAATASVEELNEVPPRGVRHHYARLAILHNGKVTDDCRVVFPGDCECEGGDCHCTVCVTPGSHADDEGPLTIQKAIDQVSRAGGRVCLAAGTYRLRRPLQIANARGLTLEGEGVRTLITYDGDGLGIAVLDSLEVSLERFALAVAAADKKTENLDVGTVNNFNHAMAGALPTFNAAPVGRQTVAIALVNTVDCRVDRCFVVSGIAPGATRASFDGSLGIGLGGLAIRTRLHDNVVFADVAVGDLTVGRAGYTNAVSYSHLDLAVRYFASLDLAITDNLLLALSAGVDFGSLPSRPADEAAAAKRDAALGPAMHLGATRVRDNLILGCRTVGVAILGISAGARSSDSTSSAFGTSAAGTAGVLGVLAAALLRGGDRVEVSGNVVNVIGIGVAVAPGNVRVTGNDVTGLGTPTQAVVSTGILLSGVSGLDGQTSIADNTIRGMHSGGIGWSGSPGQVEVAGNRLRAIGRLGIGGALSSEIALARVHDNAIENVVGIGDRVASGIQVIGAEVAEVRANTLVGIGRETLSVFRAGIVTSGCARVCVTDNVLMQIAPPGERPGIAYGITCSGRMDIADVRGNVVELESGPSTAGGYHLAVFISDDGQLPSAQIDEGDAGAQDHMIALHDTMHRDGAPAMLPLRDLVRGAREAVFVALEDIQSDPVPVGRGDIAVADNTLRGRSPAPLVLIMSTSNVTLAQNRIVRNSTLAGIPPVMIDTPGATIVSSNRVEVRAEATAAAMQLAVGSPSGQEEAHCTVLGNISTRPIRLNGAVLAAPWSALNIVA